MSLPQSLLDRAHDLYLQLVAFEAARLEAQQDDPSTDTVAMLRDAMRDVCLREDLLAITNCLVPRPRVPTTGSIHEVADCQNEWRQLSKFYSAEALAASQGCAQ
jgi:hypothetical protein